MLFFLKNVLRAYSYIFEILLCSAGLLLAAFALASRNVDVHVPWLPWNGSEQIRWIACLAILGVICVGLAVLGRLRVLLFLFSAAVLYILIRGLFISTQYTFSGEHEARNALYLVLAAGIAFIGAIPWSSRRRRP